FNAVATERLENSEYKEEFYSLEEKYTAGFEAKNRDILNLLQAIETDDVSQTEALREEIRLKTESQENIRNEVKELIVRDNPMAETRDTDYVFMRFVMDYLPKGVIGLLFAVIFSAAMSSTASELNALASTTTVDLYKRSIRKKEDSRHYMMSSKWFTALWGAFAILFATYVSLFENLIQAV